MGPKKSTGRNGGRTKSAAAASPVRVYTLDVFLVSGPVTKEFAKRNRVVSRTIEIRGDQTLQDLHYAIFDAFGREEQHAYEFQFGGKGPMDPESKTYVLRGVFEHPTPDGRPLAGCVDRTTLDSLGLKEGDRIGYEFDFGDDWWHQVNVEGIEQKRPRARYPRITRRVGKTPPQYADFDED
jgi:hypothetical protein